MVFTGHKGLMGPQGIGGICIRKGCRDPSVKKQVEQESLSFSENTARVLHRHWKQEH